DLHALRNMLNNITMNAELVKLMVQQDVPNDQVLDSVEKMLQECKHCARYLNQR
ncbi:MAG TPA: histidine kinase, partial [Gammaproteobacteria bacterium]|nr:histidine kinase [Gammaproteobacteria bacterium]